MKRTGGLSVAGEVLIEILGSVQGTFGEDLCDAICLSGISFLDTGII